MGTSRMESCKVKMQCLQKHRKHMVLQHWHSSWSLSLVDIPIRGSSRAIFFNPNASLIYLVSCIVCALQFFVLFFFASQSFFGLHMQRCGASFVACFIDSFLLHRLAQFCV